MASSLLKRSDICLSIALSINQQPSGSTQLSAFECWEIIKSRRDAITDISTYEFWRRLGIPGKGTSLLKVWRVIERLDQNYNAVDFFVEGTEAMISFDS